MERLNVIFVLTLIPELAMGSKANIIFKTGSVGESVKLQCSNSSPVDAFDRAHREIKWSYLFEDTMCSHDPTYVTIAICEHESWDYLSYGHNLEGNDECCGQGIAYMRSTEPGNFTYQCREVEDATNVIREVTFVINIDARHVPPCLAKPGTSSQTVDLICRNFDQRDCQNGDASNNELSIKHKGVPVIPHITLANMIVARVKIKTMRSLSLYRCHNQHNSSRCIMCFPGNECFRTLIGAVPTQTNVLPGADAEFECGQLGPGESLEYDWRLSRHIPLSRVSGTASSTLKISSVQFEDDGLIVTCGLDGTPSYSQTLLRIVSESTISSSSPDY